MWEGTWFRQGHGGACLLQEHSLLVVQTKLVDKKGLFYFSKVDKVLSDAQGEVFTLRTCEQEGVVRKK